MLPVAMGFWDIVVIVVYFGPVFPLTIWLLHRFPYTAGEQNPFPYYGAVFWPLLLFVLWCYRHETRSVR